MGWVFSIWAAVALPALCAGLLSPSEERLSPSGYHLCPRNETRATSFPVVIKTSHTVTKPCGWLFWKMCSVTVYQSTYALEYRTVTVQVNRCCHGYERVGRYCALPLNRSAEFAAKPGCCPNADRVYPGSEACEQDVDCPGWQKCCRGCGSRVCSEPAMSANYSENGGHRFNVTVTVKTDHQQLTSKDGGLLNHTRLLQAMLTGALPASSVYYLASWPVHPYRTAASLLIECDFTPSLHNVTSELHPILKHIQEVVSLTVEDVNECTHPSLRRCSSLAECNNTVGSYRCACHGGYVDIDPSNPGTHCAAANTSNTTDAPVTSAPLCNTAQESTGSTTDVISSTQSGMNATSSPYNLSHAPPTSYTSPSSTAGSPTSTTTRSPPRISRLQLGNITGISFCLYWSSESQAYQTYRVVLRTASEVVDNWETNGTMLEVTNLQPGVVYNISVTPYDDRNQGDALHTIVRTDSQTLDATTRFTNIQFTADLENATSQAYKNLTMSIIEEICVSLSPEMKAMVASGQVRIVIRGFSPGSVVVDFTIVVVPSQSQDIGNMSAALLNSLKNSSKFTMDDNSTSINDNDECASGENDCSQLATCNNTWASYTCVCRDGFVNVNPQRPGRSCQAITPAAPTTASTAPTNNPTAPTASSNTLTTTSLAPTTSSTAPTTASSTPTSSSMPPSTTSFAPATTSSAPTTTSVAPTTTSSAPTTTSVSTTTSIAPTPTFTVLVATSTAPTTTSTAPTTTSTAPTTGSTAPTTTSTVPTTGSTAPTTTSTVPTTASTAQTTTSTAPTTASTAPTTTSTAPTTASTAPTTTSTAPTTASTAPTTTSTAPTTASTAPTTTSTAPTTTSTAPTTTSTTPTNTSTAPTTTSTTPTTTSTAPTTTSSAPTTTSTPPTTSTATTSTPPTTSTAPTTTSTTPTTTSVPATAPIALSTTYAPASIAPTTTSAAPTTTSNIPSSTSTALRTTSTVPTTISTATTRFIVPARTTAVAPPTTSPTLMTTTILAMTAIPTTVALPATTASSPRTATNVSMLGFISVQCVVDAISVTISKDFLLNNNIMEHSLYLGMQECGTNGGNATHVQLTVAWDNCSTSLVHNNTNYVASVTLFNRLEGFVLPNQTRVVPKTRLEVPIVCTYMRSMLMSADFSSIGHDMIKDVILGSGSFQVTVQLLNGTAPLPHNYSLSPEEAVVVEVSMNTSSEQIKIVISSCWATPTPNPLDISRYIFLDNRCALNSYTNVLMNGNSSTSRVSVQIFSFVNLNMIYLHCQVQICVQMGSETCVPDCVQRTSRFSNAIGTALGSSGPLLKSEADALEDENSSMHLIGLSCLGLGLCLIFIVGLVCLFYYHRNRIGHYNFNVKPKEENFTYLVSNT